MAFNDKQERLIERAVEITKQADNVIMDDYTRFNTIHVGNVSKDRVNFEVQLMYPLIAKTLGYDLEKYYQDPYYNFEKTLEYRIWHYENVDDDSPFIGIYEMEYGVYSMEYTQMGIDIRWIKNDYPVVGHGGITGADDLKRIGVPDFFTTGVMPRVIESYHKLKEDLNGRLPVGIRKFFHGPTQFACDIYGIENFYMDMLANKQSVKEMMDYYMEFLKAWTSGWEKLHGRPYGMIHMAEDQVDTQDMLNAEDFREQIFPYYEKLGNEYDSVHWHSCGDVNNIMEDISRIPNIGLVEIGPVTDEYEAAKKFQGTDAVFYKCVNPLDFLDPKPGVLEKVIENATKASELTPIKLVLETPDLDAALNMLKLFRKMYK
jgi:hypothetical protein